jgi:hypothetical protein
MEVVTATRALLERTLSRTRDVVDRDDLEAARARLDGPLTVAVAGRVKAGKSTLVNAMLGQAVAPTDAAECTRVVTWYRDGPSYRIEVVARDGSREQRPFLHDSGALRIQLGRPVEEVDRIEVWLPSGRLRKQTLVDTPGIASLSTQVSARSIAALADDERPAAADAVLYLLRHMHSSDVRFLEAFHGSELAHASPVNAVGVLSRADEVGLCRMDAMDVADRVAGRYRNEPALRRLCPVVLPVAGLLAEASSLLREEEYRALVVLAGLSVRETVALLLTAEDFVAEPCALVSDEVRRRLLTRMGLYGVRMATHLVRTGAVTSSTALVDHLRGLSGLTQLQALLDAEFGSRAQLLKARSALAALDAVLARGRVAGAPDVLRDIEELRSGAHEFEEIRQLHLIRSGSVRATPEQLAALEQLLGGTGHDASSRLGLAVDVPEEAVLEAARVELDRWRRTATHPLSGRDLRLAAATASRTCEQILATDVVRVVVS